MTLADEIGTACRDIRLLLMGTPESWILFLKAVSQNHKNNCAEMCWTHPVLGTWTTGQARERTGTDREMGTSVSFLEDFIFVLSLPLDTRSGLYPHISTSTYHPPALWNQRWTPSSGLFRICVSAEIRWTWDHGGSSAKTMMPAEWTANWQLNTKC